MFKVKRDRSKAFTLVEVVITITVIGILFIAFVGNFDFASEKSKLAGVQTDFRAFYHAVKAVGYENKLCLLSDEEFEEKLNSNLDNPLQFKNGVSTMKDPWDEPYVYTTFKDAQSQNFYIMFASKGGRDRTTYTIEDVIRADSDDEYKVTMAFKQVMTDFRAIDSEDVYEKEIEELLKTNIELVFGSINLEAGLYDLYGNVLATWDDLVNTYGINVQKDYTESTYLTDMSSPRYILTHNATISPATKLVLPESITSIGDYAFANCTNLKAIILTGNIYSIGNNAFYGCTDLRSIVIPDSVSLIDDETFKECYKLTKVILQEGITTIKNNAFLDCTELPDINLPESAETLGDGAFKGCKSLRKIKLSDNLNYIGNEAFKDCIELETITIPSEVKTIGSNAFNGCTELKEAVFKDTSNWYIGDSKGSKNTSVSSEDFENTTLTAKYLNNAYANKYWSK